MNKIRIKKLSFKMIRKMLIKMYYKNHHGVKSAENEYEYVSAFAKSNHRLWRNYSSY